jgi:hypothetical protein
MQVATLKQFLTELAFLPNMPTTNPTYAYLTLLNSASFGLLSTPTPNPIPTSIPFFLANSDLSMSV